MKVSDISELNSEQVLKVAEKISCHVRMISATMSPFLNIGIELCPNFIDTVKKNAESFEHHIIDGKHHIHMDYPEKILLILEKLICTTNKI